MKISASALLLATLAASCNVLAADAKTDGKWRGSGGAAASISSGNTRSDSINLNADGAKETTQDKLSLYGQIQRGHSQTVSGVKSTTANQWKLGTRYDYNISAMTFGFGGLDFSSDELQSLTMRSVVSAGLGHRLIKTAENQFDIFGGVSYRADRYISPGVMIDSQLKTRFNTAELLLGEESNHKLTDNTTFKQRLAINPNLGSSKGYRATFDAALLVAINKTMSLTVSIQDRYNSVAAAPVQKNDFTLFTGVNVKFGG